MQETPYPYWVIYASIVLQCGVVAVAYLYGSLFVSTSGSAPAPFAEADERMLNLNSRRLPLGLASCFSSLLRLWFAGTNAVDNA